MSGFMNSIPVVGHAVGLGHYLLGDVEEGNKAMKAATRTTAVVGAGAVGMLAGPAGAAGAGAAAGIIWDTTESCATGEATGYIKNVENIVETAEEGKLPVKELLQTTVGVAGDALTGYSGGCLASAPAGQTYDTFADFTAKSFITAMCQEAFEKEYKEYRERNN